MKYLLVVFLAVLFFVPQSFAQNNQSVSIGLTKENRYTSQAEQLKNRITAVKAQLDNVLREYRNEVLMNESEVEILESTIATIQAMLANKKDEMHWSRMPMDSLCGFYSDDNGSGNLCMGHNPHHSCPDGFERAQVYYESSGTNRSTFCIKTRDVVEDVSWDKMPAESVCGFSSTSHGGNVVDQVDCLGHNPMNTCPPDYRRVRIHMESSGPGYLAYCVKE